MNLSTRGALRSLAHAFGYGREMAQVGRLLNLCGFKETPEEIGSEGELAVARVLRQLPPEFLSVNNVMLRSRSGGTAQIDHATVSPAGIVVIETKNLKGLILGDARSKMWQQQVGIRAFPFRNPLYQNAWHLQVLREYFPEETMISVVVFCGDCTLLNRGNNVFMLPQLREALLSLRRGALDADARVQAWRRLQAFSLPQVR